ncbi:MAG TPA: tyrosine-protein phosphatase [Steroidobacteraceae bacterium]|nr:tyrosine-protein phosphatase [Steroidobacteraceae bacterium]
MYDARRLLNFPSLLNARDLGGYPTVDGAQTRWRSLLRSDDLAQLTLAGLQAFSSFGIETVVDLRWPEEIAASPTPITRVLKHIRYEQISLLTPTPEEWRTRRADSTAKELWNRSMLQQVRRELKEVLGVIAHASPGPLLFHCMAGKDRTGVIAALLLALADAAPEAIAYDYAVSTENLRDAYLERYADAEPAAIIDAVQCPEAGVHNMLAYLETFGGARAYLEEIGLESADIARLRARLRD